MDLQSSEFSETYESGPAFCAIGLNFPKNGFEDVLDGLHKVEATAAEWRTLHGLLYVIYMV